MAQREWEIDHLKLVLGKVIARDFYNGHHITMKVLDFEDDGKGITKDKIELLKRDFMQEVCVGNKLDHPNVVNMIGATMIMPNFFRKAKGYGCYCIVAKYIKGGSLKSYLMKNQYKKLPFKTVIQFALNIARGLRYLHSKKIIHRDVKPENMFLDKNCRTIKITDFGDSLCEPSDFHSRISGKISTCCYMAPEVHTFSRYMGLVL